jgi:hypothetical protein
MPVDHFQRLVLEFERLWVAACVERLERLKSLWEPWITRMLTEPMPDDWEAELDRFVEDVRHSCGLIVSVDSIGQIENLLRARAGGTGIFAAAGPAQVVRNAPARLNPAVRPGAVRRTNPNRPSTQPRPAPAPPTSGPPLQAPSAGGMAGATLPEEDRRYYTGDRGINAWLDENYDFDALREQLVKNWWDNFFAAAAARTQQRYAQLKQTADLLVKAGLPQATADRILREAEGPFVMAPGTNFDLIAEARKKLWQAAAQLPQSPKLAGAAQEPPKAPPPAPPAAPEPDDDDERARLHPYGGPGGGHHVAAKSAFRGAAGYNSDDALAIPNAELVRLGVRHTAITGAQRMLYRRFSRTNATLTWDDVERIETEALTAAGMNSNIAAETVRSAIQALQAGGVAGPSRIPWGGQ